MRGFLLIRTLKVSGNAALWSVGPEQADLPVKVAAFVTALGPDH